MISTRAPSRAPFTVAVEITSGPRTCSRATVGLRPRRSKPPSDPLSPSSALGGNSPKFPILEQLPRQGRDAQEGEAALEVPEPRAEGQEEVQEHPRRACAKGQEARGKRQALQGAREGILPPRDRGEPCRPKKNGRRRLILPRPRLVNVIALVESIQRADAKERRKAMPRFDEDLAKAASKDMAAYVGEVMSSVSFRSNAQGANGIRTKQVFTRFGWCEVRHPYRVGTGPTLPARRRTRPASGERTPRRRSRGSSG